MMRDDHRTRRVAMNKTGGGEPIVEPKCRWVDNYGLGFYSLMVEAADRVK